MVTVGNVEVTVGKVEVTISHVGERWPKTVTGC